MKHFYKDVPRLGNVAVSRHAQDKMEQEGISEHEFQEALLHGDDTPEGFDIVWRERDNLRIVVLINPTPNVGAKLVKTVFRLKPQETTR